MTPPQLLDRARDMLAGVEPATAGLWPRCVAFLLRQAIEAQVSKVLDRFAPGFRETPMRTQLIALAVISPHKALARRVAYTWHALSGATHYHGYELAAGAVELRSWMTTIETFVMAGAPVVRRDR